MLLKYLDANKRQLKIYTYENMYEKYIFEVQYPDNWNIIRRYSGTVIIANDDSDHQRIGVSKNEKN